jgi:hypothetical protein
VTGDAQRARGPVDKATVEEEEGKVCVRGAGAYEAEVSVANRICRH